MSATSRFTPHHRLATVALIPSLLLARASLAGLPAMPPIQPSDSLLIVAPHPDDESLCCGGLVYQARAAGAAVAIVWITSGDAFRWDAMVLNHAPLPRKASYRALALTRQREARAAAADLGVNASSTYFLGYPDGGVLRLMQDHYQPATPWRSHFTGATSVIYQDDLDPGARYDGASLVQDFEQVLDRVHPTLVLAPSPQDLHPDHRGAGLLVSRALAARGDLGKARYWIVHGGSGWPAGGYELRAPQTIPPRGAGLQWEELRLDDRAVAAKLQAISEHQSQMKVMGHVMRRYVRSTELYALAQGS